MGALLLVGKAVASHVRAMVPSTYSSRLATSTGVLADGLPAPFAHSDLEKLCGGSHDAARSHSYSVLMPRPARYCAAVPLEEWRKPHFLALTGQETRDAVAQTREGWVFRGRRATSEALVAVADRAESAQSILPAQRLLDIQTGYVEEARPEKL